MENEVAAPEEFDHAPEPMEIEIGVPDQEHVPAENMLVVFLIQNENKLRGAICCLALFILTLSILLFFLPGDKNLQEYPMLSCQQNLIIVSMDGSAQYRTISEAVNAAKSNNPERTCIVIRTGWYNETVTVSAQKINLAFIGDGSDKTIINSNGESTLVVIGSGFVGINLTVTNTANPDGGEAVAMQNMGDESVFYRCKFVGYGKTLYASVKQQLYRECEIQGSLYFIYGASQAVFQKCIISSVSDHDRLGRNGSIIVAGNDRLTGMVKSGFVFQMCTFRLLPTTRSNVSVYLGAPVSPYSTIVVMKSYLDGSVAGWKQRAPQLCTNDTFLAEYMNHGPGAASHTSFGSPCIHPMIQRSMAEQFSVRNFLNGSRWIPHEIPYQLDLV